MWILARCPPLFGWYNLRLCSLCIYTNIIKSIFLLSSWARGSRGPDPHRWRPNDPWCCSPCGSLIRRSGWRKISSRRRGRHSLCLWCLKRGGWWDGGILSLKMCLPRAVSAFWTASSAYSIWRSFPMVGGQCEDMGRHKKGYLWMRRWWERNPLGTWKPLWIFFLKYAVKQIFKI